MNPDKIRKISVNLPVSSELIRQSYDVFGALQAEQSRRAAMQPWERQAEDERRDSERRARVRLVKDETQAAHAAELARVADSPQLVAVLNLHAPVVSEWGGARCEGCDMEGYEAEWPDFPCSTYRLITTGSVE